MQHITGSFNFTKAAQQSNAENLLVIRQPQSGTAIGGHITSYGNLILRRHSQLFCLSGTEFDVTALVGKVGKGRLPARVSASAALINAGARAN